MATIPPHVADTVIQSLKNVDAIATLSYLDISSIADHYENTLTTSLTSISSPLQIDIDRTTLAFAIGIKQHIYITDDISIVPSDGNIRNIMINKLQIQSYDMNMEEIESVTCIKWLESVDIIVGYSSGILRIFRKTPKPWEASLMLEQKFHSTGIQNINIHQSSCDAMSKEVWVLYTDSTIVIIKLSELQLMYRRGSFPGQVQEFRKYALRDQSNILDVLPCGSIRPTVFQSHARRGLYSILSIGSEPFLAFAHAGNDQTSIIHMAHIATAMASKAAEAVWSFAASWAGITNTNEDSTSDYAADTTGIDHVPTSLSSVRRFTEELSDARRKGLRVALSPSKRLAAVTDTLGRIHLVDTHKMILLRMWKGYRNAQVAWMHGYESRYDSQVTSKNNIGLYLVMYSPKRGIIEMWRARYGPRTCSIAVGQNAKIFTIVNPNTNQATCVVLSIPTPLHKAELHSRAARVQILQPNFNSTSSLLLQKYFAQSQLQEESFVLHDTMAKINDWEYGREQAELQDEIKNAITHKLSSFSSLSMLYNTLWNKFTNRENPILSLNAVGIYLQFIEIIEIALKKRISTNSTISPSDRSLHWRILWLHHLISTYISLAKEFQRATDTLSGITTDPNSLDPGDVEDKTLAHSIHQWKTLMERQDTQSTCYSLIAIPLSLGEYLSCFRFPFDDVKVAQHTNILSLYETIGDTSVPVYSVLGKAIECLNLDVLCIHNSALDFFFKPILTNVFAVHELQKSHQYLLFHSDHGKGAFLKYFLEWFSNLPVEILLMSTITNPGASSSFSRWLKQYFVFSQKTNANIDNGVHQSNSGAMQWHFNIFDYCITTVHLVHGLILSKHCRYHVKSQNLASVRWEILDDGLLTAMYIGFRLGRIGNINILAIEKLDGILETIALLQLQESQSEKSTPVTLSLSQCESRSGPVSLDKLALDATDPIISATKVLSAFPQWQDSTVLLCYSVIVLFNIWDTNRSRMEALETALGEMEGLNHDRYDIRIALACYCWERYLRSHVVSLVAFWEDQANGKFSKKGLESHVARKFFNVIFKLLSFLSDSVKAIKKKKQSPTFIETSVAICNDDDSDSSADYEEDEGNHVSPKNNRDLDHEIFSKLSLHNDSKDKSNIRTLNKLRTHFQTNWPPNPTHTKLMATLYNISYTDISMELIQDHLALLVLLDSSAAHLISPIPLKQLFFFNGDYLCKPNSFFQSVAIVASDIPIEIKNSRVDVVGQLLRKNKSSIGMNLAELFALPKSKLQEKYVCFLYASGADDTANSFLTNGVQGIHEAEALQEHCFVRFASIVRARVALILSRISKDPEFAHLVSTLPADDLTWICAKHLEEPISIDLEVEELDAAPSLSSTNDLIHRCLAIGNGGQLDLPKLKLQQIMEKLTIMSVMVKDIIKQVKQSGTNHSR